MRHRLKDLRNALSLTQQEFADRIGTVRSTIAGYELGKRVPSNPVLLSICKEFGVNETWLRTGEGPMFVEASRADQVKAWLDKILVEEPDSYKVRLAAGLAELDEAGWEAIYTLAVKMVGAVADGSLAVPPGDPDQDPEEEEEDPNRILRSGEDAEDEEARLEEEAEMIKQSYIESRRKKKLSASSGGGTSTA